MSSNYEFAKQKDALNLKATLYQPRIIEETDDFAVVYKPPEMHSAPLKKKEGSTLFTWYSCQSPHFFDLVHRLDFETHGLVLIAKSKKSFEHFKSLQESDGFVKEYSAVCACYAVDADEADFPQPPVFSNNAPSNENPLIIESYFRPFGRGRKLVRPVTEIKKKRETAKDRGGFYRTEIIGINENVFTVRIKRGFRHQIRCHLWWIGFPILNDPLYHHGIEDGSTPACEELALRAHALFFTDPSTKEKREYRIDALDKTHV